MEEGNVSISRIILFLQGISKIDLTYSEWAYVPDVAWLPDSSGVRVIIPASDPLGDPTEVTTVWNVPVSEFATVLDTFVAAPAFASAPVISPDGSILLYLMESSSNYTLQVRQVGVSDTGYTSAETGHIGIVNISQDSYPNSSIGSRSFQTLTSALVESCITARWKGTEA